jgi:nitroimidazol reductase NimA-like FMN-containing flavoprotein (pyridoxamine 5'-phosphate oxidase superfamily)
MSGTRIKTLGREECLQLLARAKIGRVGISVSALPVILPVHFTLYDESILFRTLKGTKLSAATSDTVVAFQADDYDPVDMTYWSVLVQGFASAIKDPSELEKIRNVEIPPWVLESADEDHFVRVETSRLSGRRFEKSRKPMG